jgi:carbon monoxide dehydrogenase subunit G
MQFTNHFEVPLPPQQAWPLLLDVERMVPCMPGAELIEVIDDSNFKGKVSVRLGPVALTFVCTATFEAVDNTGYTARIKSQGADAKGRGNANAVIDFRLEPSAKGAKASITTDLSMSGTVAQYGRGAGMLQTVANQIVTQFSKNLEAQIVQMKQAQQPAVPAAAQPDAAPAQASAAPAPTRAAVKPIGGFSLIFSVLWQTVAGWFRGTAK